MCSSLYAHYSWVPCTEWTGKLVRLSYLAAVYVQHELQQKGATGTSHVGSHWCNSESILLSHNKDKQTEVKLVTDSQESKSFKDLSSNSPLPQTTLCDLGRYHRLPEPPFLTWGGPGGRWDQAASGERTTWFQVWYSQFSTGKFLLFQLLRTFWKQLKLCLEY